MKRFLVVFFCLLLGVSMLLPAAALADTGDEALAARRSLAIRAPLSGAAGEKLTLKVIDTNSGAPVPRAGVWAIYADKPGEPSPVASTADMATNAIRLGFTGADGTLTFALNRTGWYVLAAFRDGYNPGFGWIRIVPGIKEMAIRAPEVVKVLQPVSIRVVEKSVLPVETPVAGAAVWAVSMETVAALDTNTDLDALTAKAGRLLGYSDAKGYITPAPTFNRPGKFWLVALKAGYAPSIARLVVEPLPTVTAVPAPETSAKAVKPGFSLTAWLKNLIP